jgi:methionyl-tRNA formyltransferase
VKLIYFGSGSFGKPTLEALSKHHEILAIVTQPNRPAGRRRQLAATPIAEFAEAQLPDVPILKPQQVNSDDSAEITQSLPADALVVIAFGQKLGQALLADRFAINLHASRLPRWRGAAPINHAILAGDTITGNSVITLAQKMDAGQILAQSTRAIQSDQTAGQLHDALASDGPALVIDVLRQYQDGTLDPQIQDESLVTLAPKLSRSDARIDFTSSAGSCRNQINGLSPWPGVGVTLEGRSLKLLRAVDEQSEASLAQQDPGLLLDPARGLVACGEGSSLRLLEVQPAGKKPMSWEDFARGREVKAGQMFEEAMAC